MLFELLSMFFGVDTCSDNESEYSDIDIESGMPCHDAPVAQTIPCCNIRESHDIVSQPQYVAKAQFDITLSGISANMSCVKNALTRDIYPIMEAKVVSNDDLEITQQRKIRRIDSLTILKKKCTEKKESMAHTISGMSNFYYSYKSQKPQIKPENSGFVCACHNKVIKNVACCWKDLYFCSMADANKFIMTNDHSKDIIFF